ncbi:hypothetical protein Golob_006724 [Gossypium lobatum]|uniref:RING-CH-type domain-containing protein n=1 Tax=Gossypium lobatum TaxID=34289 RepID=A0A7J8MX97_9ROSI|nr:hypothetical protein [Gossypium lobatum]
MENSSSLVEGNVNNDVVSSEGSIETIETRVVDERLSRVGDECVVETIVVVESNGVLAEMPVRKVPERDDSCAIDINGSSGGTRWFKDSYDGERVCRICHLNSEQLLESNDSISTTAAVTDLIQLGCGCKDELGIAHSHCAEIACSIRYLQNSSKAEHVCNSPLIVPYFYSAECAKYVVKQQRISLGFEITDLLKIGMNKDLQVESILFHPIRARDVGVDNRYVTS